MVDLCKYTWHAFVSTVCSRNEVLWERYTWLQWILNVEHGGPVAIHHVLLNLIFGNIAASIFYPDACFQVVEVATVELKEFNEQNTDVDVRTADILPVVKLDKNTVQLDVRITVNGADCGPIPDRIINLSCYIYMVD